MGAYDAHPRTVSWFEAALRASNPRVRLQAVRMLEWVDTPMRRAWIMMMRDDVDERVGMAAEAVHDLIESRSAASLDLFESDFAHAVMTEAGSDMEWEWEYDFVVCEGLYVPSTSTKVWVKAEDDEVARDLALMKAGVGRRRPDRVAIMVGKQLVNRYTRAPRNLAEALTWARRGRPLLDERG